MCYARGVWSDHVRKTHVSVKNDDYTRVVLADFSATHDLRARETDDCSINNHVLM